MDKGAHFYRCDFQVHTPRDLNWIGQDAISDEDRKIYSEELIKACREKSINAIAITDHHDLAFFQYIKKAAQDELEETGGPIPDEKRIIVFPGIELTLTAPNCQALLILDANFPENLFESVLTALAIAQNPPTDSKHAEIVRIPQSVASDLCHLYQILNNHAHLKGRFIVLPNVTENGHGTMLRAGFANFYKSMPCVGGYIDGVMPQPEAGNYGIIHGKNRDYGFKSIGVFQTSDNRKRDHGDLGNYVTWVKWAEPTAEALRQACLAKESRISQDTPNLPSIFVTSIEVSNSKFMGRICLEFNQQYNAVIGGRGTGKSTILEYLRWGLCDQIPDVSGDDEMPVYQKRREKLIDKTLLPFDSTVQVSFIKNNVPHAIRRKATSNELLLKIGTGEFEICSEENVRNLLPIQAYSQKQLSSVGVRVDELRRLIYSPVRQSLNEFDSKFEKLRADIKGCYELRLRKRLIETEVERNELELKSLNEQVDGLRKGLKGMSAEDKQTIASHKQYEVIEQLVDGWQGELTAAKEAIAGIIRALSDYPTAIPDDTKLVDNEHAVILDIHKEVKAVFEDSNSVLKALEEKFNSEGAAIVRLNILLDRWKGILAQHKQKYEAAKQNSTSQEATLNQIQKIEDRVKDIRKSLVGKKQGVFKAGDPEDSFNALKEEWFAVHKARADLLAGQCALLSGLSDNNLKATLGRGKGTANLEKVLKEIIFGARVQGDKIEELCRRVSNSADPIREWHRILLEVELLADFDLTKNPGNVLPPTPILNDIGFTTSELRRMAEKITSDNWIDLFLVQLDDLPLFEYKTRDREFIDFTDASAGQQATALMHVLLNQEGPPLVIDQPEDDLDNQMVSEIATLIWQAKKKRQLIFTSHNANIVVNGDSELVICCDYKVAGDQSMGEVKKLGAIDIADIREEITKVMEGGEDAFKLRKEKYGF